MRSYKYRVYRQYPQLAVFSVAMGVVSLALWLVPVAGVISSFAALTAGKRAQDSDMEMLAIIGMVTGGVGLLLSVLRSSLVYLLG